MKFSREYFIHYYQVDINLNLSIVSLLRILEDIAIIHSDSLGVGLRYYMENNLGWMLARWEIEIKSLPVFKETISVITEPRAFSNIYANRKYELRNESNELLITANTLWVFVNTKTRRPLKVNRDMYAAYGTEKEHVNFTKLSEVPSLIRIDSTKSYDVRQSDFDTNGHVNNSQYVAWALESLPEDVLLNYTAAGLKANYLKEINGSCTISSNVQINRAENFLVSLHSIVCESKEVCRIEFLWNR